MAGSKSRVNQHFQDEMLALSKEKSKVYWEEQMKNKVSKVSEEKLLNEMFVLLEYSDSFTEFVKGMSEEMRLQLFTEIKRYYGD